MIIYVLQYDSDNGAREDWNVFYTPLELFATRAERAQRKADIKAYDPEQEFCEVEITLGEADKLDWLE